MTLLDIVALALIQGITEFLPISSSGHLILWPLLTGRADQGVAMDVAVHLGTLAAVCLYFRADLAVLAAGALDIARGRVRTEAARLALLIALATVPAVVFGALLAVTGAMEDLRALAPIGWATLIGGGLLYAADRLGPTMRSGESWGLRDAVLMGLAQALALFPGTSRAGACMAAARALGFDREEGARLALLMAVPTILAAGAVQMLQLSRAETPVDWAALGLGSALSCGAALVALRLMMRMFRRDWTMTPFVLYRVALGLGLLTLAYS